MKRFFVVFALLFATIFSSCSKEIPVEVKALPVEAQQFMASYYSDVTPILVIKDIDDFVVTYKVSYKDGTSLEFNKKGEWIKVEAPLTGAVPTEIVPVKIKEFVDANYPDVPIIKIEKDKSEWEIKLATRVEFTFNKDFILIESDLD